MLGHSPQIGATKEFEQFGAFLTSPDACIIFMASLSTCVMLKENELKERHGLLSKPYTCIAKRNTQIYVVN